MTVQSCQTAKAEILSLDFGEASIRCHVDSFCAHTVAQLAQFCVSLHMLMGYLEGCSSFKFTHRKRASASKGLLGFRLGQWLDEALNNGQLISPQRYPHPMAV